ncbi:MAG: ATP-binding protein [Proteobacteria bacterium]|nr:ATP-binding protein [Pseudomonadota bacterium]
MLNLYQLQSFVTVISEGSMTGAADKLYLTQPAISQQIRNLEEDLGVDLLVRGVRQIKPTLQGEVLFDYAKRILQLGQQAEVAVKAMGAELKGQLRIGTLNSLGVHLISPIVSRLLKYNPKLSIKIDYDDGEELVKAFKRGELDAVILPEVETEYSASLGDVEKRFLMKEELWLVGSGKETDMPKQMSLNDMKKYPVISFSRELPEFNRGTLEALRQPLETGRVTVARASAHVTYPARFQLVAAMNPCRCGHLMEPARACGRAPRCGADYQGRISGPLLDRIDLAIDVPAVAAADLALPPPAETSADVAARVAAARAVQRDRLETLDRKGRLPAIEPDATAGLLAERVRDWAKPRCNADTDGALLEAIASPDADGRALLARAAERLSLSARAWHRTLRVARTLADLDGAETVRRLHIAEALSYRRAPPRAAMT